MEEKRIYIGLNPEEKMERIKQYLSKHPDVKEIVYYYPVGFKPLDLSEFGLPVEYRTFWDVVRYMFNVPLLERVNKNFLLIYDEMLRVKKRNDISYNACHHVANQTNHTLLFEYLPIIDSREDFMILIDYVFPWRYKMQSFEPEFIKEFCAEIKPHRITMKKEVIELPEDAKDDYEAYANHLFDSIDTIHNDPNALPGKLEIYVGQYKQDSITNDTLHVARNARYKNKAVTTYQDYRLYDGGTNLQGSKESKNQGKIKNGLKAKNFRILDFPTRTTVFADFLKMSGAEELTAVSTGLSVDEMYYKQYQKVLEEMEVFWNEA